MRLGLLAIPIAAVALVTACGTQRIVPQPSNLSGGDATPLVRPLKLEYGADGRPVAQPHIMFPRGKVPRLRPAVANMVYGGGPIQSFPAIYVVFWGFASAANDPNHEATDIINFTSNLGGSSWANTLVQYSQTGPTEFIANPTGELKGTWYDTTNPVPASPTQTQIQTEALNAAAHFNVYSSNADYVVALPTGHDPSGFGTTYCAWHSGTLYNWTGNLQTSTLISYTNLPYMTDKGSGCGQGFVNGASGTLDGVSIVLGHELAESQSDPWPDTGWADSSQNEIGDKCAWTNLQNTQFGGTTLGTNEFPTQPLWSNAISGCTQSSSLTTPTPSPVPTATPIPGPTPTPGPFNNTVLGLNPLAFYQLNETSGTTVADSSGHGYNGTSATSIATLAAPGLFSGAQSAFTWTSPSNDQISLPSIPFTASSTVTFVVKAGTTQKAAFPVNYWNNGFGYYEGHPAMTGIYGNTCCHIYIDTHHTLQAGTAYLLTFVSNPSHRLSYISVNGSALTQMAGLFCRCAAVAAIDASKNAGFAGTNCPSNYDQYCSLSDVAIFPYALSQTQINSLATSSSLAVRAPGGSATRPRRGW